MAKVMIGMRLRNELSSQKQGLFQNLWINRDYLKDVTDKVLASLTEGY